MDTIPDISEKNLHDITVGRMYSDGMDHTEKIIMIKALESSDGNQIEAAKILGLHRNTVRSKIKKYNIDVRSFKK